MSNLVIVAIPAEDDLVWEQSSEKVPHVTLLYLGEDNNPPNLSTIVGFVEHAANTMLHCFTLDVEKRGTLGSDDADVAYFSKWGISELKRFRDALLQEPNIKKLYDSTTQYPEWIPHLTMGYPKAPAIEPEDRHNRATWIKFDRISVWTEDFEGPEFDLQTYDWETDEAVYMGQTFTDVVEEQLAHYGVKGMKWGVRRSRQERAAARKAKKKAPVDVEVRTKSGDKKKTKVLTKGGENQPAHKDAIAVIPAKQKLKKSGIDTLSNDELRSLANRMNLEQQVRNLSSKDAQARMSTGKKFINDLLTNPQKQQQAANQVSDISKLFKEARAA